MTVGSKVKQTLATLRGAEALDGKDVNSSLKTWQSEPHNIYEVNTETQKTVQITNGKYFNFMPKYLSNNEILFVRGDGDSLSFNSEYANSWYYGHYKTEMVIDVFEK